MFFRSLGALCLLVLFAACTIEPFNPDVETPFGLKWGMRYQDMLQRQELDVSPAPAGTIQGKLLELPSKPKDMPEMLPPQLLFTDKQGLVAIIFDQEYTKNKEGRDYFQKVQKAMHKYYGPATSANDEQAVWEVSNVTVSVQKLSTHDAGQKDKQFLRLVLTGQDYFRAQRIMQQYQKSKLPGRITIDGAES